MTGSGMGSTADAVKVAEKVLWIMSKDEEMYRLCQEDPEKTAALMTRHQISQMTKAAMLTRNWRREGRQALAIHPELAEDIALASSAKIDPVVFRALPYINPMVVYPDAPKFKAWSHGADAAAFTSGLTPEGQVLARKNGQNLHAGDWMRLLGFVMYAHGVPDFVAEEKGLVVNTNEPMASMIGMMLVFEVLDSTGKIVDYEEISISLDTYGAPRTLSEFAKEVGGRFIWTHDAQQHQSETRKLMLEAMKLVVGSVLYLCSTVTEVEKVPPKFVAKHSNRQISRKPISLFKVGWTTGAALSRLRQERARAHPSEQPGIEHQRQDPQHRKAHFKMQPYGPGNSLRKSIFVSAYWTHRERLGEQGVNIARRVV